MEPKQILIRVLTKFEDAGVQAAKKAVAETANQINRAGKEATKSSVGFDKMGSSVRNVVSGFRQMRGGILGAISSFNIFDNIFGRVTIGLATWEAWRRVKQGFEAIADATVNANAKMQVAFGAFTAFSGGSEESANQFIGILKQLSVETGVAFDTLLDNAKALPTKVGQNFQAFEEIAKTAIALGFLDPAQGVEGAFFALRNALEGGGQGLRSLIQRFEIGTVQEFNAALEETGDVLSALQLMLKRTGLDVDTFIESQRNTYPVLIQSIQSILKELLRISTSKVFQIITDDLVRLRDWLQDNQAALEAIARVVADKLVVAFGMFKAFLKDIILGGQDLTAANIFQALIDGANKFLSVMESVARAIIAIIEGILGFFARAANFIANLFGAGGGGQIQQATTQAVETTANATVKAIDASAKKVKSAGKEIQDTVTSVAQAIVETPARSVSGIVSSLTSITEGGKETIKRFVNGLVEGLDADALSKVRDAVLDNIIDLEQQELDQEKSVKRIEDWVDAAAKEVDKARDRLKLFDINTADIPERFTRARRRQLELEVLRAEQEEKRRKAALDAAKEQLAVTKDILQAQRQILSELESAVKAASGAGGIDTGFTPPTIDLEAYEKQVQGLIGTFQDRLQPLFTRIREDFEKLGQVFRGIFGAEGIGKFNEFYETGERIRQSIADISGSLGGILDWMDQLFSRMFSGWSELDPTFRKFVLAILGIVAIKNIGAIPAIIKVALNAPAVVVGLLSAIFGIGGVTIGTFVIPVSILMTEVYLGWPELIKWFNGERWQQIEIIIAATLSKPILDLFEFFGFGGRKGAEPEGPRGLEVPKQFLEGLTTRASEVYNTVTDTLNGLFDGDGSIVDSLLGLGGTMLNAAEVALSPIVATAQHVYDNVVGNSIVPDMIARIIGLFTLLPTRLQPPLQMLRTVMAAEMALMRNQWIMDWQAMAQATVNAVNQINAAQMQIQTSAATSTASSASASSAQLTPIERIRLELNAQETRRLMEEGVADGMTQVARGLRGPGARGGR